MSVFDVIYADPPWSYRNLPDKGEGSKDWGGTARHYETMTLDDICSLKVPAARDAVLYLWATAPLLPEALRVMEAWGFRYKTNAVWDKQHYRIGYWFRGQHEHLLVGVRGNVSPPPASVRRSSVFSAPRTRHSAKPREVRQFIEAAFPDARKLEMFAREAAPGWSVWGNEVESDVRIEGCPQ